MVPHKLKLRAISQRGLGGSELSTLVQYTIYHKTSSDTQLASLRLTRRGRHWSSYFRLKAEGVLKSHQKHKGPCLFHFVFLVAQTVQSLVCSAPKKISTACDVVLLYRDVIRYAKNVLKLTASSN